MSTSLPNSDGVPVADAFTTAVPLIVPSDTAVQRECEAATDDADDPPPIAYEDIRHVPLASAGTMLVRYIDGGPLRPRRIQLDDDVE